MLMAGTILGGVFRADLSKNRVDVETNNLRELIFFPLQNYFEKGFDEILETITGKNDKLYSSSISFY